MKKEPCRARSEPAHCASTFYPAAASDWLKEPATKPDAFHLFFTEMSRNVSFSGCSFRIQGNKSPTKQNRINTTGFFRPDVMSELKEKYKKSRLDFFLFSFNPPKLIFHFYSSFTFRLIPVKYLR